MTGSVGWKTAGALAVLCLSVTAARADVGTAQQLVDKYAAAGKAADASWAGPSAAEGKAFFTREVIQFKGDPRHPGKPLACASCHTANPADPGKNVINGKAIQPLSPAVNPKRFADAARVEKRFAQHCNDVVGSDCTAQEKASYIAYLLTETTPSKK